MIPGEIRVMLKIAVAAVVRAAEAQIDYHVGAGKRFFGARAGLYEIPLLACDEELAFPEVDAPLLFSFMKS